MLSDSSRARSTPRRSISAAISCRRATAAAIPASCRACVARSERCRSSNRSQFGPQRAVLFAQPVRLRLQLFEIRARLLQHLLFYGSRRFAFIQQPLIAFLLLPRPAAFLPQAAPAPGAPPTIAIAPA